MPFPRENAISRRMPYRPARKRQLVIGGLAEVSYLTGLYAFCGNPAVQVHHAPDPIAPAHLVALADEYQTRHAEAVDEVWVLLDGEDLDWADVAAHADEAGVRLGVSNPCFETWLLLHFHDKPLPAGTRSDTIKLLRQYVADYDPRRVDFHDYRDGLADAVDRARPLALRYETELSGLGAAPPNPYSGVWALAESIATRKGHHR